MKQTGKRKTTWKLIQHLLKDIKELKSQLKDRDATIDRLAREKEIERQQKESWHNIARVMRSQLKLGEEFVDDPEKSLELDALRYAVHHGIYNKPPLSEVPPMLWGSANIPRIFRGIDELLHTAETPKKDDPDQPVELQEVE